MRARQLIIAGLILGAAIPALAAEQQQPILSAEAEFNRFSQAARAMFSAGRYAEALQMSREAHAFAAAELGPTHPLTLRTLNDIAVIHQMRGDKDAALPVALRAAGELERTAGADHAETLNALANLAQLHVSRGERKQAEPLLRRVQAARERTLGAGHEATLNAVLELAVFLRREQRLREIAALLDRSAAAARAEMGAESAIAIDLTAAAAAAKRPPGQAEAEAPVQ